MNVKTIYLVECQTTFTFIFSTNTSCVLTSKPLRLQIVTAGNGRKLTGLIDTTVLNGYSVYMMNITKIIRNRKAKDVNSNISHANLETKRLIYLTIKLRRIKESFKISCVRVTKF